MLLTRHPRGARSEGMEGWMPTADVEVNGRIYRLDIYTGKTGQLYAVCSDVPGLVLGRATVAEIVRAAPIAIADLLRA